MFEDNQPQQAQSTEPMQSQQPTTAPTEQPTQTAQPDQPVQPPKPAEAPIKTTQDERMWAAIGYVAFLGVVTLAMKPKSEFCKHHASQGLVLFFLWFIGLILLAIGSFFSAIGGILMLGITVLSVLGIIKAISSYELKVPVLSGIANKVPVNAIVGSMTGKKPIEQPGQPVQQDQAQSTPVQPQTPEQPETPQPPVETPEQPKQ
jgi:uncharacterized membrane protein